MSNMISKFTDLFKADKPKQAEEPVVEEKKEDVKPVIKEKSKQKKQTQPQNTISDEEYENMLTKEQQELKSTVVKNHEYLDYDEVYQMLTRLSSEGNTIKAIFITDKQFNNLFIFKDVENFISLTKKMEMRIDFTYLYALNDDGPQYYGIDEYTSDITRLFNNIATAMETDEIKSIEDIQNIDNINIFHNIYADFI